MKCKDRIINEMMHNASEIMDNKLEFIKIIRDMAEKEGDFNKVNYWNAEIQEINVAITTIRKNAGTWA